MTNRLLGWIILVLGLFLLSLVGGGCCMKQYTFKPTLKDVKGVIWEDRSRFTRIQGLKINNYHPELKILFSSPMNLTQLSQDGVNIGSTIYIIENGKEVELLSGYLCLEAVINSSEDYTTEKIYPISFPYRVKEYLYSVFVTIRMPDIFRGPSKLIYAPIRYNLLETNSDIFVRIRGGVAYEPITLNSEVIRIPNAKLKEALSEIMPLKVID